MLDYSVCQNVPGKVANYLVDLDHSSTEAVGDEAHWINPGG